MEPQQDKVDEAYLGTLLMMEALTQADFGITFLQWLYRLTGFEKPIMCMEDACRRDLWLSVRRFIPIEKLGEIEHFSLKERQITVAAQIQAMMEIQALEEIGND